MTGSPPVPITGLSPLPGGGSASGRRGVSGSRRATAATACWARKESGGPLRTVSRTVIASRYPSTPGDSAQRRPDEGERLGLEPRLLAIWQRAQRPAEENRESVDGGPRRVFEVGSPPGLEDSSLD